MHWEGMRMGMDVFRQLLFRFFQPVSMVLVLFSTAGFVYAGQPDTHPPKASARASAQSLADEKDKAAPYVQDELLIKFKEGVTDEKKEHLHAKNGTKKLREYKPLRLHRVKLKEGDNPKNAAERYKSDKDVEYAEPNFIVSHNATPDDPSFSSLWGM